MPKKTTKKPKKNRVLRSDEELLEALNRHVALLNDYHNKAFIENDSKYFGEVAGKLRLLLYRSRTCKPLLLDLMKKFRIEIRLNLIGPGNRSANIDEYFNRVCGAFRSSKTNNLIEITRMQVVTTWAQQIGANHEDTSIDEDFIELISQGFFINGRQIAVDELRRSSQFTLGVADEFLKDISKL